MKALQAALPLILKSIVLSARMAGLQRRKALKRLSELPDNSVRVENIFLKERVAELESLLAIKDKRLGGTRTHYSITERLNVIWHSEYYQVPRCQTRKVFGIARSTLYRWFHCLEDEIGEGKPPANKTPASVAKLVWTIAKSNPMWGRHRISLQAGLLKVFVAASTVRNILTRPMPEPIPTVQKAEAAKVVREKLKAPRSVKATFPNHVWSADLTTVLRWGLFPTRLLLVIDHYSRRVLCATPMEGPNAAWPIEALTQVIARHGPPRHMVTDQGEVFHSKAFAELLKLHKIKHRFGAIGRHGSIAVTERVIRTLKEEWLRRVAVIRGMDHLGTLSDGFLEWYNHWRPHMRMPGQTPVQMHDIMVGIEPCLRSKIVPIHIETKVFEETRVRAFRLPQFPARAPSDYPCPMAA